MRFRQPVGAVTTLTAALLASSGCKKDEPVRTPGEGEPARRAAQSFVHCVEQGGSGCVETGVELGAWDAFSMLGWLASGSPISILQALPRELEHHRDPKKVQRRFVEHVERRRDALRGAECRSERVDALSSMLPKLQEAAQTRLTAMGLGSADMQGVIAGLGDEAGRGLGGGYLVSMRCAAEPRSLFVATSMHDGRHVVVGMLDVLPEFLGGEAPNRESGAGRPSSTTLGRGPAVQVVQEGVVHPWVAIPVEEF